MIRFLFQFSFLNSSCIYLRLSRKRLSYLQAPGSRSLFLNRPWTTRGYRRKSPWRTVVSLQSDSRKQTEGELLSAERFEDPFRILYTLGTRQLCLHFRHCLWQTGPEAIILPGRGWRGSGSANRTTRFSDRSETAAPHASTFFHPARYAIPHLSCFCALFTTALSTSIITPMLGDRSPRIKVHRRATQLRRGRQRGWVR